MLKGFPNGEPAEVSKPDSNELVFNLNYKAKYLVYNI